MAMERDGTLDIGEPYHLGAVQAIGVVLIEHACSIALRRWNNHVVRARGGARNIGTPSALRAAAPKLPARLAPPADAVAAYEQSAGSALERMPEWLALRDPVHNNVAKQQRRQRAVAAKLGNVQDAWADILHDRGSAFRAAFNEFLQHQ
jgi:hypothetical protein